MTLTRGPKKLRVPVAGKTLSADRYLGKGGSTSVNRTMLREAIINAQNRQKPLFDLDERMRAKTDKKPAMNIQTPQEAIMFLKKGELKKADLPGVVYWLGYYNDPDDLSANKAYEILLAASQGEKIYVDEHDKVIEEQINSLSKQPNVSRKIRLRNGDDDEYLQKQQRFMHKKEKDRLVRRKRKKAQYTHDAYTGNGTEQPGEIDTQLETADYPQRYKKKRKNVQPKPGEETEEPRNVNRRNRFGDEYREAFKRDDLLNDIYNAMGELNIDELKEIQKIVQNNEEEQEEETDINYPNIEESKFIDMPSPDEFANESFSRVDEEIKKLTSNKDSSGEGVKNLVWN